MPYQFLDVHPPDLHEKREKRVQDNMYAHAQGEPIRMWRGRAIKLKLLVQNMLNYTIKHMTKIVRDIVAKCVQTQF